MNPAAGFKFGVRVARYEIVQDLAISPKEAWDFFTNPYRLVEITPGWLNFHVIEGCTAGQLYEGQLIRYRVKPLLGIPIHWVTEIRRLREPNFFLYEQRFGPFRMWHYEHHFLPIEGGMRMIDRMQWVLPGGWLGALLFGGWIKRRVKNAFEARFAILTGHFGTPLVQQSPADPVEGA